MKKLLLLIAIIGLPIFFLLQKQKEYSIVDDMHLLTTPEIKRIGAINSALLEQFNVGLKIIIIKQKSSDINQLAVNLFQKYKLHTHDLLLLIDPHSNKVKMEVGYDLEDLFPDTFVGYIEGKQMLPFFEVGQVGVGIEATTELIIAKAKGILPAKLYSKGSLSHASGGAGASMDVKIDSKKVTKELVINQEAYSEGATPEETFERYLFVLQNHIKDPNLKIYTPESQSFFAKRVVTDAQQDNSLRETRDAGAYQLFIHDNFAVIRFAINNRNASPYFLMKGPNGWMIDFGTMNKSIRFNHSNFWHFTNKKHPYMFAFKDCYFDKNGYPHTRQKNVRNN